MLANALFFVALIAVAAMTFLSAGLTMTRAASTRFAQSYLTEGYQRAVSTLQERIATQIESAGSAWPLPAFTPLPAQCAGAQTPCTYETSAVISVAAPATPAATPACDAAHTNCAANEQANAYVDENRVAARITAIVTTAAGVKLATRSSDVLLRTIAIPPYVLISGARDGSFDAIAAQHTVGDDGGLAPATPNPCNGAFAGAADDTAIRVAYKNAETHACSDGSAWRSPPYDAPAPPAGWSP